MKKRNLFLFIVQLMILNNLFGQITFQKAFTVSPTEKHEVFNTNDGGYAIVGRKIIRLNIFGDTLWTRSNIFGSSALNAAVQTLDGGFALSGYTNSAGIGLRDFFLIKTDSLGNILWSKAYGGINHDEGYGLYQTSDSGFIISGSTRSVFLGSVRLYLVRTDLNGNLLWTKSFNSSSRGETVLQTNDGGFIVSGGGTYKLDSNGNIQWSKAYNGPGGEQVKCIRQTADGGYILTGTASYFDTTNIVVAFLFKIDSTGVLQWSHYYANDFTIGNAVEQTNDGGYIVAVQKFFPTNYSDISLIKTNSAGDTLWTKTYGGVDFDLPWSVKQTNDGGYIIGASSEGFGYGIYVIKTDNLGNSGCNQLPSAFSIIDSMVTELAFTDTVSAGGTSVSFLATQINGTTVIPLCFSNSTGVEKVHFDNSFQISPNPSTNKFIVKTKNNITQGSIRIMSVDGVTVFEQRIFNTSKTEIQINKINAGICFVQLLDGNNIIDVEKLVVIK